VDSERRHWLKRLVPTALGALIEAVEQELERNVPPRRRPPGAISEILFQSACTRCGKCAESCPHDSIFTYSTGSGIDSGTPVMLPDQRACRMCERFPCASACPSGALLAPKSATWSLGTVFVEEESCIAFQGPECGACAGLCPDGSDALKMLNRKPMVITDDCSGCGLCIEACPCSPSAIRLEPLSDPSG
jgi:ferredoxin-type protein NapG